MKLKNLLVRWFWLAIIAIGLVAAHIKSTENADAIAEQQLAPAYVPLTDAVVYEWSANIYNGQIQNTQRQLAEWQACTAQQAKNQDYWAIRSCGSRPEEVTVMSQAELLAFGHKVHRDAFVKAEVAPRIGEVKNFLAWAFGIAYLTVGLFALLAFRKWFTSELLPIARRGLGKIKDAASIPHDLGEFNANRKLRQAESDFLTVKNLYDNGLITEEMLLQRKAELTAVLDSNQLFRKEDGASS
jgi:hypothetical protein